MIEQGTAPGDNAELERYRVLDQLHVEGETLRSLLQRAVAQGESIPQALGLRIALDLVEAMEALASSEESSGLVALLHGGLTLDSVHIGADGRTRLLDPAAAAAAARTPSSARHPVRAAYTAPEHIDGRGGFDVRSDIFSFGVLLWETLACRSLFGAASYEEVRGRVLRAPIPRVQRERFLRGEPIAAALATLVARALQRDPARRFQNYAELAEALRGAGPAAEREEVAVLVRDAMQAAADAARAAFPDEADTLEKPKPPRVGAEPTETRELSLAVTARPPAYHPLPAGYDAGPKASEAAAARTQDVPGRSEHEDRQHHASERVQQRSVVWRARAAVAGIALAVLAVVGWLALRPDAAPAAHATRARPERVNVPAAAQPPSPAPARAANTVVPPQPAAPTAAAQAPQTPEAAPDALPATSDSEKRGAKARNARGRQRAAMFVPDDI